MVEHIVYLGGNIRFNGSFAPQLEKGRKSADRAFAILLNFQRKFPQMSFSQFLKLYFSMVYPCLAYAAEVYCWTFFDEFNRIFLSHMRRYLGVPRSVSGEAIHWMTGTLPIYGKIWTRAYKFWMAMARLPSDRLESTALKQFRFLHVHERKSWFSEMLICFDRIGFQGDFVNWGHTEISENFTVFKEKIGKYLSLSLTQWKTDCAYDFLIKNQTEFRSLHFLDNSYFPQRRTLSRIVLRCCGFESVTGAWHSIHKKARLCTFCFDSIPRKAAYGNEEHNIAECPCYTVQRNICCGKLK